MTVELPPLPDDLDCGEPLEVTAMGVYRCPSPDADETVYAVWGDGARRLALRFPNKVMAAAWAKLVVEQLEVPVERQVLEVLQRIEETLNRTSIE